MTQITNLAKLDQATKMLAEIKTIDDAKKLVNLAEAARVYAREAELGLEAQNHAAEIKLRAQRRAGEILGQMKMRGEREIQGGNRKSNNQDDFLISKPTLSELGIENNNSTRWQQIAQLPKKDFEEYIADSVEEGKELTTTGALRLAKELRREDVREKNRELVNLSEPIMNVFDTLFKTVVIDPPWDWGDEGDVDQFGRATPTYATMPLEEIAALPIADLTEPNAHLYLWITNRSLPKGFGLLETWGFRYVTALTWCKPSIGMGNYFRGSTEHILFGVRGSLPLLDNGTGTWFSALRSGSHSQKPDEFYKIVEKCSPGPWLDMFARNTRNGWGVWGAECQ